MALLFAVSLLAFAALLWAAVSVVRTVRRSRQRARRRVPGTVKPSFGTGAAVPAAAAITNAQSAAAPPPPPRPLGEGAVRLRSFPTRLGQQAASAASADTAPRWNPFREGYGDLSDPAPSRRSKDARPPKR